MAYKYLLFDCDRTLLDFDSAMVSALKNMLSKYGFTVNDELISFYNLLNESLWKELEEKKITKEELVHKRFPILCSEFGIEYPGNELMENDYFANLSAGHDIIPGSDEVLKELYGRFQIYVITNGFVEVQIRRMEESGLKQYVEKVYISEGVGYSKPDKRFIDAVMKDIGDDNPKHYMIIGDSMSADIGLGHKAGIDTVLVGTKNPEGFDYRPTYQIASLKELDNILEG